MARLFTDENFPNPVVKVLRRLGHNVVRIQESANYRPKIPDLEVLEMAQQDRRAVLTLDKDYSPLHKANPSHSGIVLCTDDKDRVLLASRIHERVTSSPDLSGQLHEVYKPSLQAVTADSVSDTARQPFQVRAKSIQMGSVIKQAELVNRLAAYEKACRTRIEKQPTMQPGKSYHKGKEYE